MRGWFAVYYREILILKRKFIKQTASMAVAPLLYLIAFGFGLGKGVTIDTKDYIDFLIPGLIAMSSMTQAFAIASEINIARFYWHIFEEFQAAPIQNIAYVTGEVFAGITRSLLSVIIIILLGLMFHVSLSYNLLFWLAIILNSFVFASIAVCSAMLVKSHADQALVNNFIITPMAFLSGTFFPINNMPLWAQRVLDLAPLTHASKAIRASAFSQTPPIFSYVILTGLGLCFFIIALYCVKKAKN